MTSVLPSPGVESDAGWPLACTSDAVESLRNSAPMFLIDCSSSAECDRCTLGHNGLGVRSNLLLEGGYMYDLSVVTNMRNKGSQAYRDMSMASTRR